MSRPPKRPASPAACLACLPPADAARSALGVLVRYAPQLPPALLEDLVFRMGQCSMTESARNLARAVAAAAAAPSTAAPALPGGGGSGLQDPGVAALLAALVGGRQATAVQGTLQASCCACLLWAPCFLWAPCPLSPKDEVFNTLLVSFV